LAVGALLNIVAFDSLFKQNFSTHTCIKDMKIQTRRNARLCFVACRIYL